MISYPGLRMVYFISVLDNQSFTDKAITFEDGRAIIQEREGGDIVLTLDESTDLN